MGIERRDFVKGAAAAGALLVARPVGALGELLGPASAPGAARGSRLFPGTRLAHADLHNHTLLSDGAGDADAAFASMRAAGLDVAALTDHSTLSKGLDDSPCLWDVNEEFAHECQSVMGLDEKAWAQTGALADAAYQPNRFVAIRGFEWSSPTLGHMNVWFSQDWTDPRTTLGLGNFENADVFLHREAPDDFPPEVVDALGQVLREIPATGAGMALFYEWLAAHPKRPVLGGGRDGIAGFNHPGREPGRFSDFSHAPALQHRLVSVEVFNRREDYLFEGTDVGEPSPIQQCLDAGWRVGLLGVTDEHGTEWGMEEGKGRTGLWVRSLTRQGVREAMLARRFFATRRRGLRVDASAAGVQMGGELAPPAGLVEFRVDVDKGPDWVGKRLLVQVLSRGSGAMPAVVHTEPIVVPADDQPVVTFDAAVDAGETAWVFLRITDPDGPADSRATGDYSAAGNAVAYTAPWFVSAGGSA